VVEVRLSSPSLLQRLAGWIAPTAPAAIRVEVERRQLARIQQHVPMIYGIASLNTLIVMAVCAHTGVEPRYYAWMSLFVVLAAVRTTAWLRRSPSALTAEQVSVSLKRSAWIAFACLFVIGAFTTWTFVAGTFARSTLIPITLAFGSMSIAHCFATLRPSAVAALVVGIVPSSVALLVVGHFDAQVLGVSMLSVVALMIRFVASQFDQLVTELELQTEVHHLANTDALTNLLNRRALVALIEKGLSAGESFAIALLDLDDFKGVNDRLGHLAGDALLRVVSKRLVSSAGNRGTVGRLGGDEFLVVFHAPQGTDDVNARVATLLSELCQPAEIDGESVPVSASLGFSIFPRDGNTTAALMAAADEALYATKRAGIGPRSPDSPNRRRHRAS
jgi:diguanylate cyclase